MDIHCYSNVWRSICTAWMVCMPSWCDYHPIALVIGTIHPTIDCVYLLLPGWYPPLAELQPSQANNEVFSIQWHQLRVVFPLLGVGSRVGWLQIWDNLINTQFAPRYTSSEWYTWYVMPKECLASQTILRAGTQSHLEALHSWGAWLFCKLKPGLFCVH
jgi:hypothetical protein